MLSRWIMKFAGISTICLAICAVASAQYGGGGGATGSGATPGTPGYVAPSGGYGSGKAIGIGVGAAAGAAVAAVLLVRHHHHVANNTQAYVTGCMQSTQNGISLTNEKNNQTYLIVSNDNSLKAGERMTLKGSVESADGSADPSFHVISMVKDFGACGQASASNSRHVSATSLN
jgi:microcystin-dependent protein